jgi:pantoate--beta-alanine ligase
MKIIKTIKGLQRELQSLKRQGKRIGFVPTMGYFHEGHLTLMRQSKRENDVTVVSLFVNPTQFGPKEDLAKYPRDLRRDAKMASSVGVDVLFVPTVEEMYPRPQTMFVDPGTLADGLCGASRPGHFRGVATVVAKLINIVGPDKMYLGRKDAQQVAVLKRMVADLNIPVIIRVGKTVRERDGLAMSSRNTYLSPDERTQAPILYRALQQAKKAISSGETDAEKIISQIKTLILEGSDVTIDYVSVVDATNLQPVRRITREVRDVLIAVAAKFGTTRLIDNTLVPCRQRR